MYKSLVVADHLIEKSEFSLSNLRLNKLLYFIYGVNLVVNESDKQIFDAPEAWDYGPVFPDVYHTFKVNGSSVINHYSGFKKTPGRELDATITKVIDKVLASYGKKQDWELVKLTHLPSSPWSIAYKNGRNQIISKESIKAYFIKNVIQS